MSVGQVGAAPGLSVGAAPSGLVPEENTMNAKNAKHTKQISGICWDVSPEDRGLILQLAARASALAGEAGITYKKPDAVMDLTACHANGAPLRLAELLATDKGNFGHDVFGIRRHLDCETGKLGGFFSPRYAVRKAAR